MIRRLLWIAFLLSATPASAEEENVASRLRNISGTEASEADWLWAAHGIADNALRTDIRAAILSRTPYPRAELVALLSADQLAVRLGALELLEEAAGATYGFNPWASPAGPGADPANETALKLWTKWSGASGAIAASGNLLSDDQLQAYLRDIVSGNEDRRRRAVRMLEPHGLKGVTGIQDFLINTPGLPASSRVHLKEAQYQLVLTGTAGENAAVLARDLAVGNRDQQLAAIAALKKSGLLAIPIARDFLDSDDSLVRETAVDTILTLGGAQTVSIVIPYLKEERDTNVIHVAMRRFRDIGGTAVRDAISGYVALEDEDLVVAAVESLTKICGKASSSSFGSDGAKAPATSEINASVARLLVDPRWRVRAAALEYVASIKDSSVGDQVILLLDDEDEFVRAQAISAAVALQLTSAKDRLTKLFLSDDDMIAPATTALTGMEIVLPPDLVAHLDTRPPDVVVGAIKALNRDTKPFLEVVARYVTNQDRDIACAALRSLADDSDKLAFEFVANHLTDALQSDQPEKIEAVLDSLRLPSVRSGNPFRSFSGNLAPSQPGTTLDPLYDAFLQHLSNAEKPRQVVELEPSKKADANGGLTSLKEVLSNLADQWKEPNLAFRAALLLAQAGEDQGFSALNLRIAGLSVSERAAIADSLYGNIPDAGIPLMRALIQDDLSDVRKDAANCAFDDGNSAEMVGMAFQQLEEPGTKLNAFEAYGYNLERLSDARSMRQTMTEWARRILADPAAEDEPKILALILIRGVMISSDIDLLEPYTRSANQWLRRAAWFTLTSAQPSWVAEHLDSLVADPSSKVREAIPMALNSSPEAWIHYFADDRTGRNQKYENGSRRRSIAPGLLETLQTLAESDPSEQVRFESWFTLLANGKQIDLEAFLQLVPRQPQEGDVPTRLAKHLESNYRSMGRGMRPLLAYADVNRISKSKLPLILMHFTQGGGRENSFTSFGALAKVTESSGEPQHVEPEIDPAKMAAARQRLVVIAFHKPGCRECEKVERYLEGMKSNFPLLQIERRNITDQKDLLVNQALCDRFQVNGQGKAPAIFTQAGALIAPATEPGAIANLLQETMELPDDPSWNTFGSEDIRVAEAHVEETFSNITLPLVLTAGLLDGINPCAFATIIFFLSYLQVARRSPREILMVGSAFIVAVFLAYFSIGLAFHGLVELLNNQAGFRWARAAMTWLFAAFAFLVAVLSLRDGLRARRGRVQDMTLQLPAFLKNRIRGVIRTGVRSRSFVIAAFISGLIISFLELACTGQVYAPIVFKIQQGSLAAVRYLLLYNLAFIAPLVIIFILAYRGMTSDALIRFQEKHTATVKFATAFLFLLLTLVILFGERAFSLV